MRIFQISIGIAEDLTSIVISRSILGVESRTRGVSDQSLRRVLDPPLREVRLGNYGPLCQIQQLLSIVMNDLIAPTISFSGIILGATAKLRLQLYSALFFLVQPLEPIHYYSINKKHLNKSNIKMFKFIIAKKVTPNVRMRFIFN